MSSQPPGKPPSQAGRFKPRKPVKRVRPGGSSGSGKPLSSAAVSGSTVSSSYVPDSVSSYGGRGGRAGGQGRGRDGGRGGGRGGRRGGGRGGRGGRRPTPQGVAFFAQAGPGAAGAAGGAGAKASAASKARAKLALRNKAKEEGEENEEVVGHLEEAIGMSAEARMAAAARKKERINDSNQLDFDDDGTGGGGSTSRKSFTVENFFYDSDSSLEEQISKQRQQQSFASNQNIPPNQLPFPPPLHPVGIGGIGDRPPPFYKTEKGNRSSSSSSSSNSNNNNDGGEQQDQQQQDASSSEEEEGGGNNLLQDIPLPSPFVHPTNQREDVDHFEMDSMFLVQFPTRLPSLVQMIDVVKNQMGDDPDELVSTEKETFQLDTAEVVTPFVEPHSFDGSLSRSIPGRLGRILVYKSGKTVLVLEQGHEQEKVEDDDDEEEEEEEIQQVDSMNIDDDTGNRHPRQRRQQDTMTPEIRMNVTLGQTCGFQQHAVVINTEDGTYVPLGDVKKTIVVTPDLESGFS